MPITNQDTKELNQIYSDWNETYGGVKQDYFALNFNRGIRFGIKHLMLGRGTIGKQ